MSREFVDLHTHTTYSDGSETPEELIELASSMRARAVAITDHDTVAGIPEARSAADRFGIEFVAGIEISAEYSPGTMHVLGYCIDEQSTTLAEQLVALNQARDDRNPQIARRLQSLGVDIDYDEVVQLAGSNVVGRPHFARLMVERGYVANIQDAFDKFLKKGAAAFVDKARLSPGDSIALIHQAGGVAVLAHPYQLGLPSYEQVDELVAELADFGLDGIEAVYSRHSDAERASFAKIAERYGLLVTGGSDYHGSYKPDISLVTGLGNLKVPYALLEAVKDRATSRRSRPRANES
ncbi:MAG: PHP domain-containing protein [Blastocatellia bacterium]